jgi:cell division protein FtsL
MSKERWNVAVARPIDTSVATRTGKRKKPRLVGMPVGEKLLYLFSVVVCVALLLTVVSRFAKVTELNVAIHATELAIEKAQKENLQLETEKRKLESPERIRKFAESKGLQFLAPKYLPSIHP